MIVTEDYKIPRSIKT